MKIQWQCIPWQQKVKRRLFFLKGWRNDLGCLSPSKWRWPRAKPWHLVLKCFSNHLLFIRIELEKHRNCSYQLKSLKENQKQDNILKAKSINLYTWWSRNKKVSNNIIYLILSNPGSKIIITFKKNNFNSFKILEKERILQFKNIFIY